ncbi:VOC family protein [Candidatus Woesebacteria bacterium]|jgi:predicted 3-demethylubiquinone-9 3-methyltransferase (glyoxalase superfamily)|nr:VOC family protein [Candidatus Woesebacteria bacterium]
MKKITPFLWFNNNAEEAANFYVSIFKNSKINNATPMMVSFVLDGQEFIGLNGGPQYAFTEAISMFVNCEDQAEVDELWNALLDGGQETQCGWLKDKFGLSWQIIPKALGELMGDKDPIKAKRVLDAMLTMKKIEIDKLQAAYDAK